MHTYRLTGYNGVKWCQLFFLALSLSLAPIITTPSLSSLHSTYISVCTMWREKDVLHNNCDMIEANKFAWKYNNMYTRSHTRWNGYNREPEPTITFTHTHTHTKKWVKFDLVRFDSIPITVQFGLVCIALLCFWFRFKPFRFNQSTQIKQPQNEKKNERK